MLFFELFSLNLSRLFHCSVIKVLCPAVLRDNFYILSQLSAFVNRFFHFFISFAPHHCAVYFYNSTKLYACQLFFSLFLFIKNVNIKIDIFSCFYRFAILHNTQPVLLYIFTFRQRSSKAATAASLSRSLYPLLCKLLYLFLE